MIHINFYIFCNILLKTSFLIFRQKQTVPSLTMSFFIDNTLFFCYFLLHIFSTNILKSYGQYMFKFSFLAALLFCALASNSFANKSTQIPSQCQQLFQQTEELISEAEKQPGTHLQIANIKNKLSESKKKILQMSVEHQIKSCDKGLLALNNMKGKEE